MRSTMQDVPLSVATIVRYGTTVHGGQRGRHLDRGRRPPRDVRRGRPAAPPSWRTRCAGSGVTGDERVGTFMWNNQEHLEAYLAVPAMGAVLHTLNIRLFPDQLAYIVDHAEDQVVIVDGSLLPLLAKRAAAADRRSSTSWSTARRDRVGARRRSTRARCTRTRTCSPASPTTYDWPEVDERDAAAMCYTSGTTGNPKGVVYSHRSIYLHSMQVCMARGVRASAPRDTVAARSCRCSTRWPGGCRTPRSCPAPRCSCRTGSCSPSRSPR